VTLALQVAPGDVWATSVALAPCPTEAGRLVMLTESEVGAVTTDVAVAVGAVVRAAAVAVFVGTLVKAIP
jgi:hypothetical protein